MRRLQQGLGFVLFLCLLFSAVLTPGTVSAEGGAVLSYEEYAVKNAAAPGTGTIEIPAVSYIAAEGAVERGGDSVQTGDDSTLTWRFTSPGDGLYELEIDYIPTVSKGGSIERTVLIDGALPFSEAAFIELTRVYEDGEITQNSKGHDVTPEQIEKPRKMTYSLIDPNGFVPGKTAIRLAAGEHTVTLVANKEKAELFALRFVPAAPAPAYRDYLKQWGGKAETGGEAVWTEAEQMKEKSSFTLYPVSDKSSADTTPQDPVKTRLNVISGTKWSKAGQWISWTIKAERDGWYQIAPRYRQDAYFGGFVSRRVLIDGEVPFAEAENIRFDYTDGWAVAPLANAGEPYLFYLTAGEHTLTMQVVIGEMAPVLKGVKAALTALNADYRRILMITGPAPDIYRDYGYETLIPDVLEDMAAQAKTLQAAIDRLNETTRVKGDFTNSIGKLIIILKQIEKEPEMISELFATYKDNLSSLGTWLQSVTAQPLSLDRICLIPAGSDIPAGGDSFFKNLWFKIRKFLLSFGEDYQSFASEITEQDRKSGNVVTVWMTSGREQSQILQKLTEQHFTPQTGVKINTQLVAATALLPAALAGTGPDVAMNVPASTPIDFAIRGAAVDLKQFAGYEAAAARFHSAALTPFVFSDKVYALPETMTFLMTFVRTDIFEELGLSIPTTWEEFYEVVWELQQQKLDVGFPINAKTSVVSGLNLYGVELFLFQRGGSVYNRELTASAMAEDLNVECFEKMAELFTLYKFPVDYDFANRFRSGEMPLGIQEYTMYNQLTIFASEIKGAWVMAPVPGTVREDGTVDHTSPAASSGVMMLEGAKDKEKAWQFIDWVTTAETQSRYATEVESVLGVAAKHATANAESLGSMSWSQAEYRALTEQLAHLQGTPQIPGGYYTVRGIDFAFADVYANGKNPAAALTNQVVMINEEITRKRKEFGLAR